MRTDWLVGSVASLQEQDITINGSAKTVPAGSYYLYDAADAISLCAQVAAAMSSAGILGATVRLMSNRKIQLTRAGAVNFTITWTDPRLRDLLGFTGNLAGAFAYTAPRISPLLWSPGAPGRPLLYRKGLTGMEENLTYQAVSAYSGRTESVSHGVRVYNRFSWLNVDVDRIVTSSGLGGEFKTWFDNCAVPAARFKLYHDVDEDLLGSTPAAPLTTVLGPYIYSADRKGVSWVYDRSRGFDWTDQRNDVQMNVHGCPEYNY